MAQLQPTPTDQYDSPTSNEQFLVEATLRRHIPGPSAAEIDSASKLRKDTHLQFLVRNLVQGLPAKYISQDASQPWLIFWTVQAFSVLQVAFDPQNKQKIIDTIMACQHPEGGFGGGPGQAPHLLPTYASICVLAIVGRPGPGGGWDQIDRKKLYNFFLSLKQTDGSFLVAHYAEVDVRGLYCLLVVAHLLDLLTPDLLDGMPAFIASCQTYEGGFASASQPYFLPESSTPSLSPRPPLGEAHGGYTFCSLASWVMLQPYISTLPKPPSINLRTLLRWLIQMQGTEIELGGFRGRTNKLVDGCYSWWVGGSFALLEALGVGGHTHGPAGSEPAQTETETWDDVDDALYNRKALQEYILYACQYPTGGLRDKPPKIADAYHTLYCLAGLSAAQHHVTPSPSRRDDILRSWISSGAEEPALEGLRKTSFAETLSWIEEEGASKVVGEGNKLNATHPLFNLTFTHSEAIMSHFHNQTLPKRKSV